MQWLSTSIHQYVLYIGKDLPIIAQWFQPKVLYYHSVISSTDSASGWAEEFGWGLDCQNSIEPLSISQLHCQEVTSIVGSTQWGSPQVFYHQEHKATGVGHGEGIHDISWEITFQYDAHSSISQGNWLTVGIGHPGLIRFWHLLVRKDMKHFCDATKLHRTH